MASSSLHSLCVVTTQKLPHAAGTLAGVAAGVLLERRKQEEHLTKIRGEHPDSLSYLWSFDLHPEMQKQFGYKGVPLVLSAESCGNGTRYCQDAAWLHGDDSRNNLEARVELVRGSSSSSNSSDADLPVPYVVLYTTRAVRKGEEAFLGWGTQCKRACLQIMVRGGFRV